MSAFNIEVSSNDLSKSFIAESFNTLDEAFAFLNKTANKYNSMSGLQAHIINQTLKVIYDENDDGKYISYATYSIKQS